MSTDCRQLLDTPFRSFMLDGILDRELKEVPTSNAVDGVTACRTCATLEC